MKLTATIKTLGITAEIEIASPERLNTPRAIQGKLPTSFHRRMSETMFQIKCENLARQNNTSATFKTVGEITYLEE